MKTLRFSYRRIGALGLLSFLLPWDITIIYTASKGLLGTCFFWLFFNVFLSYRGDIFFSTLIEWLSWPNWSIMTITAIAVIILILGGSIWLISNRSSRIGLLLILSGALIYAFRLLYWVAVSNPRIYFPVPIPISLLLAFFAGIKGLTTKPVPPPPPPPTSYPPPPPDIEKKGYTTETTILSEKEKILEYLKRLNTLYMDGKITREVYEALKAEYERKLKTQQS